MCVCAVSVTEKRVATQVPECRPQSQPLLIPWFLNWLLRWTYCFLLHIKETTHKNIRRQTASNWQKTYLWLFMCMYNMRSVRIYIYIYVIIYIYVCIIYTLYVLYHTSAASLQSILFAAKIFAASLGGDSRCFLHLRWGGSLHEVQRGRGSSFLKPLF